MSVLDRIRENYPTLAFLINDPEVGPLLRNAVDPNKGFSPTKFQAELMQTNYYKRKSVSARQYDIMRHTDPGTFKQSIRDYTSAIRTASHQLGVKMTGNEIRWTAHSALRQGMDPNDPRILSNIARMRKRGGRLTAGAIRTGQITAKNVASGQYFLPMNYREKDRWGVWLATGKRTEADLRAAMQSKAISKYPHLKRQLIDGQTMEDIFSGHIETISQELELDPGRVKSAMWRSSKWTPVMGIYDNKLKSTRPLTLSETRTYARKDPRFWQTTNGKQMDAGMSQFLLQSFGKRAM